MNRHLVCAVLGASLAVAAHGAGPPFDPASTGGDLLRAGAEVVVDEPVGGDALLAGGSVESNASIEGDVAVAAGQAALRATVGADLYVAAGQVEVDALVRGDARLAGGRLRIAPESRIDGGVALAGGTLDLQGSYGGDLTAAGGEVTLGGNIAGDVRIYAARLTVLPGTRIGGRLSYRTAETPALPADLDVGGGVLREEGTEATPAPLPGEPQDGTGWPWVAGLLLVGLLLAAVLARFSRRTTVVLGQRPWFAMGVGGVALLGIPVLAALLFVTLVGIPLALIVLLSYLALLIGAYIIGAFYLGDRGLALLRPGGEAGMGLRLLALLAALLVLGLVGEVPLAGAMVRMAVLLLGLGGIVLALRQPQGRPQ